MTAQLDFRNYIYKSLLELATEKGINASGKEEIYGCIFGRDSALTILKIIKVHRKSPSDELMQICRRALLTLCELQGKETNIESGEEPGKFIHEFRQEKFEHLTDRSISPWYLYPDGFLKNYDSIDSTPLILIVLYKYWEATNDDQFLIKVLPYVEMGLNWIITSGDKDKDGLLDYGLHSGRKHGGLTVQSWTDSHESLRQADGTFPEYPIAPVEAQGYAWLALRLWSRFFAKEHPVFASKLEKFARSMKKIFNELFIFEDKPYHFAAQAIDGNRNLIKTITGNPLICLWAADYFEDKSESIIDDNFIYDGNNISLIGSMVKRAFQADLFDPDAGIRTMSAFSPTFNANCNSYHNGSFWPVLNGLISEGLENFGFVSEAKLLKKASLKAIYHFNSPIELYTKDESGKFIEYLSTSGQVGCRIQAWSAASVLDWLT